MDEAFLVSLRMRELKKLTKQIYEKESKYTNDGINKKRRSDQEYLCDIFYATFLLLKVFDWL